MKTFSRRREEHLNDEEFRNLQNGLMINPEAGREIPGTGGLRKIRWSGSGHGKRGGVRIIYFPILTRSVTLFLMLYAKNEQDDLTPDQKRLLRALVETELQQRWVR